MQEAGRTAIILLTALVIMIAAASCGEENPGLDGAGDTPADQPDGTDGRQDPDAADPGADLADDGMDGEDPLPDADLPEEAPPEPEQLRPCLNGSCWPTSAIPSRCGETAIDENFHTGSYNVHAYASTLFGGPGTLVTLSRTAGAWQPAIIVAEGDLVIYDGRIGLVRDGLVVSDTLDGTEGDTARVRFATDRSLHVTIHVTGWEVVESDFTDFLPTDAEYRLTVENACAVPPVDCTVLGHAVGEAACGWLHYIALEVVPLLEGTRDERVRAAAIVGWWSLKEGVLFDENPLSYSNCGFTDGQRHIGPLEVCPSGLAWQVGLAGVQVPDHTYEAVEATALRLLPGMTADDVLEEAALDAGLRGADVAAVVASAGTLRKSWLLRSSPVGFTHEAVTVTDQCIDDSLGWCYGGTWYPSNIFAPDRDSAMTAIEEVRAILDALAP